MAHFSFGLPSFFSKCSTLFCTRLAYWLFCAGVAGYPLALAGQSTVPTNPTQVALTQSVLGGGQWFKLGVLREGIYRLDLAFFNRLGFTGNAIPVDQIRLLGGREGGAPLPEPNPSKAEQLVAAMAETALWIEDGGDGLLNGNDLVYFYAPGPHVWQRDATTGQYGFRLNPYSDTAFYFLTPNNGGVLPGSGPPSGGNLGGELVAAPHPLSLPPKRIRPLAGSTTAVGLPLLTQFNERLAWETDRVNLLSSGQTWLGEAFGNDFGQSTNRNFLLQWPHLVNTEPLRLAAGVVARSFAGPASFAFGLNNLPLANLSLPAVSGGILDRYAQEGVATGQVRLGLSGAATTLNLGMAFSAAGGGGSPAAGWLDRWVLTGKRNLVFSALGFGSAAGTGWGQLGNASSPVSGGASSAATAFLRFRFNDSSLFNRPGSGNGFTVATVQLDSVVNSLRCWKLNNPLEPQWIQGFPTDAQQRPSAAQWQFTDTLVPGNEYLAFVPAQSESPLPLGPLTARRPREAMVEAVRNAVAAAGNASAPMGPALVVVSPHLLPAANRLVDLHRARGWGQDLVLTTTDLINEWGAGQADPAALRNAMAFAQALCQAWMPNGAGLSAITLLGTGSFDPKNRNGQSALSNQVPVWESPASFNQLTSFVSDDFFAVLEPGAWANNLQAPALLSVPVGRIPATNLEQAMAYLDRLAQSQSSVAKGPWRNAAVFLADDRDQNLHQQDAEDLSASLAATSPVNQQKIYLDAFPLVSTLGGPRFPAATDALVNALNKGSVLLNYAGHGNDQRLTEEAVFDAAALNRLENADRLPLFITASCDFAPFDQPAKNALGQQLIMGGAGRAGAMALLTTTRLVFSASNKALNDAFIRAQWQALPGGSYPSLGQALLQAKNQQAQSGGDLVNARKFVLLGDPLAQLPLPQYKVVLRTLNGRPLLPTDSLVPGTRYQLGGDITDAQGRPLPAFQGKIWPQVYAPPRTLQTLGNSPQSPVIPYSVQDQVLFSGTSTVSNGQFLTELILPKPSQALSAPVSLQLYAADTLSPVFGQAPVPDAFSSWALPMKTTADLNPADRQGPQIKLFLNDTLFRDGGLSNGQSTLLAFLQDSSGINAAGLTLGQELVLVIDGKETEARVLDRFYQNDPQSFRSGSLRFALPLLSPGPHELSLRAFDLVGNGSKALLKTLVIGPEKLAVRNLVQYPNPFSGSTQWVLEHNQPHTNLQVDLLISDAWGRTIRQWQENLRPTGLRTVVLTWDGKAAQGRALSRGWYFYRIIVRAAGQQWQSGGQMLRY